MPGAAEAAGTGAEPGAAREEELRAVRTRMANGVHEDHPRLAGPLPPQAFRCRCPEVYSALGSAMTWDTVSSSSMHGTAPVAKEGKCLPYYFRAAGAAFR